MLEDLWSNLRTERRAKAAPLAVRVRPRTIDEIVGQRHCLGEGALLRRLIEQDALQSMIVAGPPGTGKTTLAEAIAARTGAAVDRAHGATTGVKELREKIDLATRRLGESSQRTLLFVDEIHRLARNQQDALLEGVEAGSVVLFGATTENPTWAVAPALLSRSVVFRFQPLEEADIATVLRRAIAHPEGVGISGLLLDEDACGHFARVSDGDVRRALSALETAANAVRGEGTPRITLELARAALDGKVPVFDKDGDEHYDLASALIKSMRGSDPDAAVYWLARMLVSGEDPRFICRRLAIFASEDIGNADPRALQLALNAAEAYDRLGAPEGELALAQAVTYLAVAAKSNASYMAWNQAKAFVKASGSRPVPIHLRNAPAKLMEQMGYGKNYRYAHDEPDAYAAGQSYFPDDVQPQQWYQPSERGLEAKMREKLAWLRSLDAAAK